MSDWISRRALIQGIGCGLGTVVMTQSLGIVPVRAHGNSGIDVTELGLVPNIDRDQSKLLQKILNQLDVSQHQLFFPPGRYRVNAVSLPRSLHLSGIPGQSVLAGESQILQASGISDLTVDGIAFEGTGANPTDPYSGLVRLVDCERLRIANCTFEGAPAMGLSLERCEGRVQGCNIAKAKGAAGLFTVDSLGMHILNNVVSDCANNGLVIHRWDPGEDNTQVMGNRISNTRADAGGTGQQGNAINTYQAHGVQITNNMISDSAFSAVRANGCNNVLMNGNTCLRSGETGLYAEFSFQGSVITNNIVDGAAVGISVANFNEGGRLAICNNNLVRNLITTVPYSGEGNVFGVGIYAEADTLVSGNVVESAPRFGLELGYGPYLRNVIANANIVRKAGYGIAVSVAKGAGSAKINDNLFDDLSGHAIVGTQWNDIVTSDLLANERLKHDHLIVENNSNSTVWKRPE